MKRINEAKNKVVAMTKNFLADESAQGMTEYILLLVVVLALAFIFKDRIQDTVKKKIEDVGGKITDFGSN